jgi:arylsulfatase
VLDGRNPLPALTGELSTPLHERIVFHLRGDGLRAGQLKVVRDEPELPWQLYNLSSDPGETHDLAKERPSDVSRLAAAYDEWRADVMRDASEPAPRPVRAKKK